MPSPSTPSSADRFSRKRLAALIAFSIGVPAVALALILHARDSGTASTSPTTVPAVPTPQKAKIGSAAPDFTGRALDGTPVTLSALRGRPVVLTFFASWCHPCEQELPTLEAIQRADGDRLRVLGVNYQDLADDSRAFLRRLHVTFPAVAEDSPANAIAAHYDVHEMPDTVFIDSAGIVRGRVWGPMTEAELRHEVDSLVGR